MTTAVRQRTGVKPRCVACQLSYVAYTDTHSLCRTCADDAVETARRAQALRDAAYATWEGAIAAADDALQARWLRLLLARNDAKRTNNGAALATQTAKENQVLAAGEPRAGGLATLLKLHTSFEAAQLHAEQVEYQCRLAAAGVDWQRTTGSK